MSSTRQSYDKCAYADKINQATNILKYNLDLNGVESCNRCEPIHGPRHKNAQYAYKPSSLVDTESILSNRPYRNTQCIGKTRDYYVHTNNLLVGTDAEKHKNTYFDKECGKFLDSEDTRFTNPKDWYRGLGFDVFYPLLKDPQCNIYWNSELNTRLFSRDTIFPKMPSPVDGSSGQPVNIAIKSSLIRSKDCGRNLRCNS